MNINLGMTKKLGFSGAIVLSIVIMLVFVVPAVADDSNGNEKCPPPVQVPVVLDGVLCQPDEFNKIHCELYAKEVYLFSFINPADGVFYAFTSRDGMEQFMKDNGLPAIKFPEGISIPPPGPQPSPTPFVCSPIEVPIVFDGKLYQPDEFAVIEKDLHDKGVQACFCVGPDDGILYGFSSFEGLKTFAKEKGWFKELKFLESINKIE